MGFFDFLKPKKSDQREQLEASFKQVFEAAFPLGNAQLESETDRLHFELRGRLSRDDAKKLLMRVKALLVMNSERDPSYLADYVRRTTNGQLAGDEARLTAEFVRSLAIGATKQAGSGTSVDDPVVIEAETTIPGIRAEYAWLEQHFGKRDRDWTLVMRSHGPRGDRTIETMQIELKDGSKRTIHFDITNFFGKFF